MYGLYLKYFKREEADTRPTNKYTNESSSSKSVATGSVGYKYFVITSLTASSGMMLCALFYPFYFKRKGYVGFHELLDLTTRPLIKTTFASVLLGLIFSNIYVQQTKSCKSDNQ